ncbi:hypothetical protein BpHYR1_029199 [Brachionus plicatilis]|uniref:Uncharacterized protein n=1 Tax=Brachionus plicatilis TaxID=10195 RepID=A0A3M7Q6K6_BRAPC|nr:hypothetical protein BpHYR1_029199 [Brachionus plicatilis]
MFDTLAIIFKTWSFIGYLLRKLNFCSDSSKSEFYLFFPSCRSKIQVAAFMTACNEEGFFKIGFASENSLMRMESGKNESRTESYIPIESTIEFMFIILRIIKLILFKII